MQIAIDGPAGAGKSTLARALAKHLAVIYLDTGAMYRAVAYACLQAGIPAADGPALRTLLNELHIDFTRVDGVQRVLLHGSDIEDAIRTPEVSKVVSAYAALGAVRDRLTRQQQAMAAAHDVVMDGRDIGTVVLPQAEYKFFLTASVAERARRRYLELTAKGVAADPDKVAADIASRDETDRTRAISPLRQADDAILIDTDGLNEIQVLEKIVSFIEK